MRQTKIAVLFMTMVFCMLSCQKESLEEKPELKLSQKEVSIGMKGGTLTVTYSIINPVKGGTVEGSSEASWISDIDCGTANAVKISVEANTQKDAREAVVNLVYHGGAATSSVTVRQSGSEGGTDPDGTFEISVEDIDTETALVKFTPKDPELTYAALCTTAEEYERYASEDEFFDSLVDMCWDGAADLGLPLKEYLSRYFLHTGYYSMSLRNLEPGVEYYAFAVGMDENGERLTSFVEQKFQTVPIEMNGATFTMSWNNETMEMTVTPSSDDVYYFYGALKQSEIDQMDMTIEESLKEYFDEQIAYGAENNIGREDIMEGLLFQGTTTFDNSYLHASSDYVGIAVSVNLQGYLNSEISTYEFRTDDIEMSDNQLSLEIVSVGVDRVSLSITASNDDQYCMMVLPTSTWPGLTPEEYLEKIAGDSTLDSHVSNGSQTGTLTGLSAATEYYILLFGYQNGVVTTDLVSETFTTGEDGNPEELQFSFSFSDITSSTMNVEIRPTPENALYFSVLVSAYYTEDNVKEYIDYMAQMYISYGLVLDEADFRRQASARGVQTLECTQLYSSAKYKMAVVGIYPDTGEYATDVMFSQTVTTEARTMSDVKMNLVADKYFNGDEIAALYPDYYSGGKGMAIVPVTVDVTGDAEKYYYTIYLSDMSDTDMYPDDAVIRDLISYGRPTDPETVFFCNFGIPVTITGVALGKDGNYSNVYRKVVTFEEDGCSPASEFVPEDFTVEASMSKAPVIESRSTIMKSGLLEKETLFRYRNITE